MTLTITPSENAILTTFRQRLTDENPLRVAEKVFVKDVAENSSAAKIVQIPMPKIAKLINIMRGVAADAEKTVRFRSIGTVRHVGNGVATLSGLPDVQLEELVTFPNGVLGMVLNLDRAHVDVILLGPDEGIRGGDIVYPTGRRLRVPVGLQYLGRVINPLGQPMDEKEPLAPTELRLIEKIAPGIVERTPVNEPLYTGTKVIDALIPLGRGQRELILGDRQTGKTTLALDAILSQQGNDVKCIYVSIAQKKTSVLSAIKTLEDGNVTGQTTVIVASPDDPPALRYIAPYCGVTMAEYFLDQGMDVLIVYDDLTKHADSYRELSLLLRRPPGREAYPGDIFYLHSRLLERACRLHPDFGGGSITALPIVATQKGNISGYIPTNLISITDGQIVLDADLFNKGMKPAVDIGRSVSRVGGSAQVQAMKKVVGQMKLELSQFEEVRRFARFGTEVNQTTQRQIDRGTRLQQMMTQPPHRPVPMQDQVILFYAVTHGYLDDIHPEEMQSFSDHILAYIAREQPQFNDQLMIRKELTDEMQVELDGFLETVLNQWKTQAYKYE